MAAQLRSREKESAAAKTQVLKVECEMRALLEEMAQQKQKVSRLNRAFADLQAGV